MSEEGNPPAWFAGADPELLGHIQAKGLDKLDATAAAMEASRQHRQAQQFIGAAPEQLMKLPKDANDPDGWREVWKRLGAPDDAAGYEFEGVDVGDVTGSLVDALRATSAGVNLPKGAASAVAKGMAEWVNKQTTDFQASVAENKEQAEAALKKSWGQGHQEFQFYAAQGKQALATRLGERLAPQLDAALDHLASFGFGEVAQEILHRVGNGLKEDSFKGGAGGAPQAMNKDMAQARLTSLMTDRQWVSRHVSGGSVERQEYARLTRIIAGEE